MKHVRLTRHTPGVVVHFSCDQAYVNVFFEGASNEEDDDDDQLIYDSPRAIGLARVELCHMFGSARRMFAIDWIRGVK